MLKQLGITIKTADATLTYSEMGDIIGNKATAVKITLPGPSDGMWYRISNVGEGLLSIHDGSDTFITDLKQTEQALLLSNASTGWFMSKGSGAMTKEEMEAVLTGEITSHTHPINIDKESVEAVLTGTIESHEHIHFYDANPEYDGEMIVIHDGNREE